MQKVGGSRAGSLGESFGNFLSFRRVNLIPSEDRQFQAIIETSLSNGHSVTRRETASPHKE